MSAVGIRVALVAGAVMASVVTTSCGARDGSGRWAELSVGGRSVDCVHVLATKQYRKGLSGTPAPVHGAWFYWGGHERVGFWMHDTAVPLWIVWVGTGGEWFGEEPMAAETDAVHRSPPGAVAAAELLRRTPTGNPVSLGPACLP
jgi:hypothetical protein